MITKKYEDAYCTIEKDNFSIDEVAYIFRNDPLRYANNFDRNMVCSFCHKVPFSFVNARNPHFRGFPNVDHAADCIFTKEEMAPEDVNQLLDTTYGENTIRRQMERLLIQFLKSGAAAICPNNLDHPVAGIDEDILRNTRWQSNRAIPQKQLNAPFDENDYGTNKIFYGKVHIVWEPARSSNTMKLLMRSIKTNRLICRLLVSRGVYVHIRKGKGDVEFDAFVAFFASLKRKASDKTWSQGNLMRSELISINKLDAK